MLCLEVSYGKLNACPPRLTVWPRKVGLAKFLEGLFQIIFQWHNSNGYQCFQISTGTFLLLILLDLHLIYSFGFIIALGKKMNLFGLICLPQTYLASQW